MSDCTTCDGSGLESKQTWHEPATNCEDCLGTGDGVVANCIRLIEDVDRLISKSNPKLAREVKDALEEIIEEKT